MPYTDAQRRATAKYQREKMDCITFRVSKESGKRDRYNELAKRRNTSLSAIIQGYLDAECEKEGL